jgi:hypothetical protein
VTVRGSLGGLNHEYMLSNHGGIGETILGELDASDGGISAGSTEERLVALWDDEGDAERFTMVPTSTSIW